MTFKAFRYLFIITGILCLVASKLLASTPDLYGISSRSSATAGLSSFSGSDPAFAYQNPAFLSQASRTTFHLGWLNAADFFSPIEGVVTQNDLSGKAVATGNINTDYPNLNGVSFGMILPLKNEMLKLSFGAAGFLPIGSLASISTLENYVPVYANYYNRPKRFSMVVGSAIEPFENFSLGLSANVYLTSGANTKININNQNSSVVVAMDMMPALAPIVGAQYQWKDWNMDLSYHAAVDYAMTLQNRTELPLLKANGSDATIPVVQFLSKTSMFYDPQMISLGVSHLFKGWLQMGLQGTWKNWKNYKLPMNQVEFTNPGGAASEIPSIGFRDVMSPSIGLEFPLRDLSVRAGYRYEPQHVDQQEANSNLIDTDVHILSTGLGVHLGVFQIDFHIQTHLLEPKRVVKTDPNVVGYKEGGYAVEGSLLNYGISLGTTFD